MTASFAQQNQFVQTWGPHADVAASQLHIGSDIVLGQWALESDWGTESYVEHTNNVGGIMANPSTIMAFPNPSAFVAVYVRSMFNDCPAIQAGHTNSDSTATEIFAGNRYNTVNPQYAAEVQAAAARVTEIKAGAADPLLMVDSPNDAAEVEKAQRLLNVHGADLAVDGSFGPLTYQAVVKFQRDHGLVDDGKIGPATWHALEQPVESHPVPTSNPVDSGTSGPVPAQPVDKPVDKTVDHVVVVYSDGSSQTLK